MIPAHQVRYRLSAPPCLRAFRPIALHNNEAGTCLSNTGNEVTCLDVDQSKIDQHFKGDLGGRRIAVWGIAFKPGTDDIRDAPAITLMKHLLDRGAQVVGHDPAAHDTCRQVLADRVTYAETHLAALAGADALVICTDWDEFRHPDFDQIKAHLKAPVIFDGRNLY